jgi:diguanylate cyclase (GGDEF)-like protein
VVVWAAVVVACAALVILVVIFEARRACARSDRHFALLLQTLDEHLRQISDDVVRGVERWSSARQNLAPELGLTVDFDDVLDQLLSRVAQLTGAHAAAIRIAGPAGETTTRSTGPTDFGGAIDVVLGTPGSARYSTMAVEWTYGSGEWQPDAYRSALAVPIVEDGIVTGALASYALAERSFSQEQALALEQLAGEAAPGLRNARLFADVARRTVIDETTGIRNRAGYELELEREVARARRTGRPLSLVRLDVSSARPAASTTPQETELVARDFAAVLSRVARSTDVLCRRADREFVALLPETPSHGAGRFCTRVRTAAATNALSHVGSLSLGSEVVEWVSDESSEAFDARIGAMATLEPTPTALVFAEDAEAARGADTPLRTRASDEQPAETPTADSGFRESLGDEVMRAHARAEPLAVVVLDVEGFELLERRLGPAAGDRVLADLETRVAEHVERRGASARVGANEFAALLRDASANEAEGLVLALQASLAGWPPAKAAELRISAGITDLTPRDNKDSVFDRARHALWQAKQTGNGTIVVAHTEGYRPT